MLKPPLTIPLPGSDEEFDEHFKKAVELVVQYEKVSASLLQRRLSVGYARAARIIDQLEVAGVVGPAKGADPREVLIQSAEEILGDNSNRLVPKQEEDPFVVPANYKVPTGLNLSKVDKIPWGKLFSDVYSSTDFKGTKLELPIPIGFDDDDKLHAESLLELGNLIIAGNPLSQKENFVDTLLLTYLLRYAPTQIRFILNDPTHYLDLYNGIPHLLDPVITEYDRLVFAFLWSQSEMERRLKQFAQAGVRNIADYNQLSGLDAIPRILIITFYNSPDIETEDAIVKLSGQGARTGIHNIFIVDRTTGKSLPSSFKSNIPARVVFRLSSAGESKAIDVTGAEKLESGEIIYKPNYGETVKLKAIFTPEVNVKEVIEAVKQK